MLTNIYNFLKNNTRIEMVMSVVLLAAVTVIACNMDKVTKKDQNKIQQSEMKKNITPNGKTVVIDPGHGGKDPGKVGVSGQLEKNLNLEIALCLKEILKKKGYEVLLTREEDRHLGEGEKFRKTTDLNMRCEIINTALQKNPDTIMVSIHQNSFQNQNVKGAQCFYYQKSEHSKSAAEKLQQKLNEKINLEKAKKTKGNNSYYMLINSRCPGVIIECGFLSNPQEEANLADGNYQKNLAETIAEGIGEYYQQPS